MKARVLLFFLALSGAPSPAVAQDSYSSGILDRSGAAYERLRRA